MAFIQCGFFSNVLGLQMQMNVIVPQPATQHIGTRQARGTRSGRYPVLYLLHGMSDDHTIWSRFTSIERYAAGRNLIVVMPAAHRSYYVDMHAGKNYWKYISEELPAIVNAIFPTSAKPEDTYACGLSMGGYGALRLGLALPEKFNAVCGLSAVADIKTLHQRLPECEAEIERIFGPAGKLKNSPNDLFSLAKEFASKPGKKPRILQVCGTEDFLYQDNLRLRDHFRKLKIEAEYVEDTGAHTWEFWDKHVQTALDFFGL